MKKIVSKVSSLFLALLFMVTAIDISAIKATAESYWYEVKDIVCYYQGPRYEDYLRVHFTVDAYLPDEAVYISSMAFGSNDQINWYSGCGASSTTPDKNVNDAHLYHLLSYRGHFDYKYYRFAIGYSTSSSTPTDLDDPDFHFISYYYMTWDEIMEYVDNYNSSGNTGDSGDTGDSGNTGDSDNTGDSGNSGSNDDYIENPDTGKQSPEEQAREVGVQLLNNVYSSYSNNNSITNAILLNTDFVTVSNPSPPDEYADYFIWGSGIHKGFNFTFADKKELADLIIMACTIFQNQYVSNNYNVSINDVEFKIDNVQGKINSLSSLATFDIVFKCKSFSIQDGSCGFGNITAKFYDNYGKYIGSAPIGITTAHIPVSQYTKYITGVLSEEAKKPIKELLGIYGIKESFHIFSSNKASSRANDILKLIKSLSEDKAIIDELNKVTKVYTTSETGRVMLNKVKGLERIKFGKSTSQQFKIYCPVDVYLYDENNNLLGSIIQNIVYCDDMSGDRFDMYVDGDTKCIDIYDHNIYKIKVIGNDNGTMNISYMEHSDDLGVQDYAWYENLPLEAGKTYTQEVNNDTSEVASFICENGTMIVPDNAIYGNGNVMNTYKMITNLTAEYGDTLADVELPDGWSWLDYSQSVGNIGENVFSALYANQIPVDIVVNVSHSTTIIPPNVPATPIYPTVTIIPSVPQVNEDITEDDEEFYEDVSSASGRELSDITIDSYSNYAVLLFIPVMAGAIIVRRKTTK